MQIKPLPLELRLPAQVSHLPPLEDVEPLVSLPREAWLDISSLASMEMILVRNTLMGEFEYCYQMQLISMTSLHLNPFEAWANLILTRNYWTNGPSEYPLIKNPLQSCQLSKLPTHKTDQDLQETE